MNKILNIFIIIMSFIFVLSCTDSSSSSNDILPTTEFTIDTLISNDSIFEENSELLLSGHSEAGVIIEASIIDEKNRIITSSKSITLEENNEWSIKLKTPKGSYDKYSIVINDSGKVYTKTFKNIEFGKVFMFIGDSFKYSTLTNSNLNNDESFNDKANYENLSFLYYSNNEYDWIKEDDEHNSVDEFDYLFAKSMNIKYKMPIGVINITKEDVSIQSFLSLESIDSITRIKEYLIKENKYILDSNNELDMCYYYEHYLSKFNNMSFEGVIFNHNYESLNDFENEIFNNFYFLSYITIIDTIHKEMNNSNIYVLGASSSSDNLVSKLRNLQSSVCNYFSFAYNIPTFDLNIVVDEVIYEPLLETLVKRVSDILKGINNFSHYANLVYVSDDDEVVRKIKIEFSNTENLKVLNTVEDLEKDDLIKVNYLDVYYNDETLGLIKIDTLVSLENNFIVINLEYEDVEIIDEEEVIVKKVYDKERIVISYGEYGNLLDYNLVNDDNMPIFPFKISLK